jgi:hypothetical protein
VKQALVLFGILFFVVLAIVVGQRLSTEAMAVVVGVVCGVVASVPVSLGLLLLLGRLPGLRASGRSEEPARRRDMPPVVVVTPGAAQPASTGHCVWPGLNYMSSSSWSMGQPLGRERNFRIIGEEDGVRLLHD